MARIFLYLFLINFLYLSFFPSSICFPLSLSTKWQDPFHTISQSTFNLVEEASTKISHNLHSFLVKLDIAWPNYLLFWLITTLFILFHTNMFKSHVFGKRKVGQQSILFLLINNQRNDSWLDKSFFFLLNKSSIIVVLHVQLSVPKLHTRSK